MMKYSNDFCVRILSVLVMVLAFYGLALTLLLIGYRGRDYQALLFLTQCDDENAVIDYFGRPPEIVYNKGDVMRQLGWKLPSREITNKVLIYTNASALRFYVYATRMGRWSMCSRQIHNVLRCNWKGGTIRVTRRSCNEII